MSETQVQLPTGTETQTQPGSQTSLSSLLNEKPSGEAVVKDGVSLLNDEKPGLKPEESKAPAADKAPAGAPETYADFKAPEGFELDAEALKEATPLFKELNLPQDQAQKLIDFYAKTSREAAEAPMKLWQDTQKAWVDEVKADPEIGGKLDAVRTTVSKAIDSLGPELATMFRQAMDMTGAGNNPAFVKAFYKFASQLTEGGSVRGNGPATTGQGNQGRPPSAASALYPNLP